MGDFEFIVSEGPSRGQRISFPAPTFVIGSGSECAVRFEPAAVQARHAEVSTDPQGGIWVKDLTGAGLVWVNGEAVKHAQLGVGAFLRVGRLEMVVRQVGRVAGPSGTMAAPTPLKSPPVPPPRSLSGSTSGVNSGTGNRSGVSGPGRAFPVDSTMKRPTPLDAGTNNLNTPHQSVEVEGEAPQQGGNFDQTLRSSGLMPGSVIDGRYQVIQKLAAGGMGEVYKAEHIELGKTMALKVMLPELSKDPEFVQRFKREAIAASRIGQQNIVDISDFGRTADGRFYFVMEFLEGMTLASLVHREGALPVERAINISLQVARALAAAHAQSIVHRDLKPENIMLLQRPGQPDFVKVLDFGVAKVSHGHGQGGQTAIGMVVGTPQYMSPEQAKALVVDARSDIYSMGLIIYELLCGRPTFTGETPSILMVKHVVEAPPPFAPGPLAEVPSELEALVFQMLEKDLALRPQTMTLVVEVLDQLWVNVKAGVSGVSSGGFPKTATPRPGSSVRISGPFPPTSGIAKVVRSGKQPAVTEPEALATNATIDEAPFVPRRSPLPFVLGGVLLLGAAAGGGYFVLKGGGGEPAPVIAEVPKVDPPKLDTIKTIDPPPEVKPVIEKVKLTFVTEPAGAEVFKGDVSVGTTPYDMSADKGSMVELKFMLKNYKPETKKYGFEESHSVAIKLERVDRGGQPTTRPTKPGPDLKGLDDEPVKKVDELKPLDL